MLRRIIIYKLWELLYIWRAFAEWMTTDSLMKIHTYNEISSHSVDTSSNGSSIDLYWRTHNSQTQFYRIQSWWIVLQYVILFHTMSHKIYIVDTYKSWWRRVGQLILLSWFDEFSGKSFHSIWLGVAILFSYNLVNLLGEWWSLDSIRFDC